MARLITIYWRDIPSQVIAKAGRKTSKIMLEERFQVAIDRAAMRAGAGTSDAYMADWKREEVPVDGDLAAAARERADQLESEFNDEQLEALTKAKGLLENLKDQPGG